MQKSKILRWLAGSLIVLFTLAIIAVFIVIGILAQRLEKGSYTLSDDAHIQVADAKISFFIGNVSLDGVHIFDSAKTSKIIHIGSMVARGISWLDLLTKKGVTIGNLQLSSPEIDAGKMNDERSMVVSLDHLNISDLHLPGKKGRPGALKGRIELNNLHVDPGSGRYKFEIAEFHSDLKKGVVLIDTFRLIPKYSKNRFAEVAGFRTGRIDLEVPEIVVSGLDGPSLLGGAFKAQKIKVECPVAEIYTDKNLPIKTDGYSKLPSEALLTSGNPIHIDTLQVISAYVEYQTINPNTKREGYLDFADAYVSVYNVTNIPEEIDENAIMQMDVFAEFMQSGDLDAHFHFPLNTEDYHFTWNGTLGPYEISKTNTFLIPVLNMNIVEGDNYGLTFDVRSGNEKATGTLDFAYRDLKVEVYNPEKEKEKRLLSFLANSLVINKQNEPGTKKYKQGPISLTREQNRGFFHYVWSSLEDGLVHILLPPSVVKKVEKE